MLHWRCGVQKHHAANRLFVVESEPVGHPHADIMGYDGYLLVAQLLDQLVNIRCRRLGVVTMQRLVRIPKSPQVRDDHLVAFRQDWDLSAPAIPELGPTMDEDHRRSLPFDHVMNIDPIDHCHPMFPLISLIDHCPSLQFSGVNSGSIRPPGWFRHSLGS